MRSLGYAIALGVLLTATSAQALDVLHVAATGRGNSAVQLDDSPKQTRKLGDNKVQSMGQGGSADAIVNIDDTAVSFRSGVASVGDNAKTFSVSGVDIAIVNLTEDSTYAVDNFHSTIIPAGMGFYLQDRSGSTVPANIFTDYGQAGGPDSPTWNDVLALTSPGTELARVGFTFDVYGDGYDPTSVYDPYSEGYEASGLYTLSGYVSLRLNANGEVTPMQYITGAQSAMPSFTQAWDNDFAFGYAWGATDIQFELNKILAPGTSTKLYYRTAVYADSAFGCFDGGETCLVAYSGFGDPIGRGGGISNFARGAPVAKAGPCPADTICGIVFDPAPVQLVGFDTTDVTAGVPEPSAWALMIAGFGLMGAALRRRRLLS